jgi:hypothetical protein
MPKVSKKPVAIVESSSSEAESDLQSESETETEIESESEPEPELKQEVTKTKSQKKNVLDSDEKLKYKDELKHGKTSKYENTSKQSKDWVDMDIEMPKHKQSVVISSAEPIKTKRDESKSSSFDYTKYRDLDLSIEDMVKYCVVKSHDLKQFQLGKIFKQILKGMNFEDVLPEVKQTVPRMSYDVRGRGGQSYRGRGRGMRGNPRTFQYDE